MQLTPTALRAMNASKPMPDSKHPSETENPHRIEAGDTVAYTQAFLDRHSQYPHEMASARGKVTTLRRLPNGTVIADVHWDKAALPKRVIVTNISPIQEVTLPQPNVTTLQPEPQA